MQRLKVIEVSAGPCLDKGLQRGDYLDTYNGIPLESSDVLSGTMKKYAGQTYCLKFIRGFESLEIDLTAGRLGINVEPSYVDEKLLFLVQNMRLVQLHLSQERG